MTESSNKVRKVTDYNQIFVKLDEAGASIVSVIGAISNESALIARYTDAADLLARSGPTGSVSALASLIAALTVHAVSSATNRHKAPYPPLSSLAD